MAPSRQRHHTPAKPDTTLSQGTKSRQPLIRKFLPLAPMVGANHIIHNVYHWRLRFIPPMDWRQLAPTNARHIWRQ